MPRRLWLLLFPALALASCATPVSQPAAAPDESVKSTLENRVWTSDAPEGPKGKMLIFLSDGTLVQDSCWETYRLSKWRRDGENRVVWEEDGVEIPAEILSLNESELRLRLTLVSSTVEAGYTAAEAPYVCPDMPR